MRILVCAENIFSAIGGGQSFYSDLFKSHPEHDFWYCSSDARQEDNKLSNVHVIPLTDIYRRSGRQLDVKDEALAGRSLEDKLNDFLHALDVAASAFEYTFDIIDIPDYMPFGAAIPPALRAMGCRFDKVAVSLHGTLSSALAEDWAGKMAPDWLRQLRRLEDMLFTGADIRYAISRRYLEERERETGAKGQVLDLAHLFPFAAFAQMRDSAASRRAETSPVAIPVKEDLPSVVFVGRQDKCKGPDLFVDLVSGVSADAYSEAILIGPDVAPQGVSSLAHLSRMAERRGFRFQHRPMPRDALWHAMATQRWVGVFPSRRDSLNLAVLESLMAGVPTLVSIKAGVCDYLDEAFPGLPYHKLDPDDLAASRPALARTLGEHEAEKAALLDYLGSNAPRPAGEPLNAIYAGETQSPLDRRMYEAFGPIFDRLITAATETARNELRVSLSNSVTPMFNPINLARDPESAGNADQMPVAARLVLGLEQVVDLHAYADEILARSDRQGMLTDEQMTAVWARLDPLSESINRVAVYRLMARLEQARGNALLHATYELRCMRLSGAVDEAVLDEVTTALAAQGFPEEAQAARWMYGSRSEQAEALRYLESMRTRFLAPPSGDVETIIDERRPGEPKKISVIVSLYNAASKLPVFFRGLRQLSEKTRARLELVLIDSCSPDDTTEAVRRELEKQREGGWDVSLYYLRTSVRESIQRAWNRGIAAAGGAYLSFLGVDEMNRPDAYDILAQHLDDNPSWDWVQGSAVVTDVNEGGSFVGDIMYYDRSFDHDFMNRFDTCYIGYVAALYRKNIHDRVGYYDDRFKGAGDSEFKLRALPHITVVTLPVCLGTFLNYPEERTTQSPMAEIEDLRAWYLHRSPAGMMYGYGNSTEFELLQLFRRCFAYRKSYMTQTCTDLELAWSITEFAKAAHHPAYRRLFAQGGRVQVALSMYRMLDSVGDVLSRVSGVQLVHEASGLIETSAFGLASATRDLNMSGLPTLLEFGNDNRSHQHMNLWRSRAQKVLLGLASPLVELAGPQDFAELLSACQATDQNVDYDRAYRGNDLKQLQRLYGERSLDIAVEWSDDGRVDEVLEAYRASRVETLGQSLVVVGARSHNPDPCERVYLTGPVERPGPVLASARGLIVWSDPKRPRLGVTRLARAIVLEKLFVADAATMAAFGAEFPELDLSAFAVADDLTDAFVRLGELLDDDAASAPGEALTAAAAVLRNHPKVSAIMGPLSDEGLSVSIAEMFRCNRAIREAYEHGGIESVQRHCAAPGGGRGQLVGALSRALFETKVAPILQTGQAVFKRILAEPPAQMPEVEASQLELEAAE